MRITTSSSIINRLGVQSSGCNTPSGLSIMGLLCYMRIMMIRRIDKVWTKFWMLTYIWDWEYFVTSKWEKLLTYICKCECWSVKSYYKKHVCYWHTISCWCIRFSCLKWINKTHWMTWTRIYRIYKNMGNRCNNKNYTDYKYRWWRWIKCFWNTFEQFIEDMYESYLEHCKQHWENNTSIDRINNDWNYCKENCRRSTRIQQANNKRLPSAEDYEQSLLSN